LPPNVPPRRGVATALPVNPLCRAEAVALIEARLAALLAMMSPIAGGVSER